MYTNLEKFLSGSLLAVLVFVAVDTYRSSKCEKANNVYKCVRMYVPVPAPKGGN